MYLKFLTLHWKHKIAVLSLHDNQIQVYWLNENIYNFGIKKHKLMTSHSSQEILRHFFIRLLKVFV